MDEESFDTIHEIVLIEDTDWWVDEEEHKRVKRQLDNAFDSTELIEFTSIDGFEISTTKDKIVYLATSTRATRDAHRARNKKYHDTEGIKKKKDWEE